MRILTLACLALVCGGPSAPAATEAIQSLAGLTEFGVITGGGAGFAFRPATNLYVNALGYLFSTNYVSLGSATVELLDSRGTVLASVTLDTNVVTVPAP